MEPKLKLLSVIVILMSRFSDALRMINLDAPESALVGDTIQLACFFSLGTQAQVEDDSTNMEMLQVSQIKHQPTSKATPELSGRPEVQSEPQELLYAIKWYHDNREFFRYLARDWPHKQSLPTDGLSVDLDKSDNHTVVLRKVSLETSGLFRCEVSTDAPNFTTKFIQRRISVYALPVRGPSIKSAKSVESIGGGDGRELRYSMGDKVQLSCSTSESKPGATIHWIVNEALNLSTLSSVELAKLPFQLQNRRFLRVPSIIRSSVGADNHGLAGSLVKPTQSIIYTDREIPVDAVSLLGLEKSTSFAPIVGSSRSLDQLLEKLESRLNFTMDDSFLQSLVALVKSLGHNQYHTKRAIDSRGSRLTSNTQNDLLKLNSDLRIENRHLFESKSSNRSMISSKRMRKKPMSVTSSDRQILKFKCISVVLNMVMSDEIIIRPAKLRQNVTKNSFIGIEQPANSSGQIRVYIELHFVYLLLSLIVDISFVWITN